MIKALIFDFDGLIVDTETPEYELWQLIYHRYGKNLPIETWGKGVGSSQEAFDAVRHLASIVDFKLDQEAVRLQHRVLFDERMRNPVTLPGFHSILDQAILFNLKTGIASSSPRSWVLGYLEKLRLAHIFDCVCCLDDVARVKPAPDLYERAIGKLEIKPYEAIAFEDAPNGILAAKKAGLYCVAIPNTITKQLDTSGSDIVFESLENIQLSELIGRFS